MQVNGNTGFDNMCPELLMKIFAKLPLNDQISASGVSKWWRETAYNVIAKSIPENLPTRKDFSNFPKTHILPLSLGPLFVSACDIKLKCLQNKQELFTVPHKQERFGFTHKKTPAVSYPAAISTETLQPFSSRFYSSSPTTLLNVTAENNQVTFYLWDHNRGKNPIAKFTTKLEAGCQINPACVAYSYNYIAIGYQIDDSDGQTKGKIAVFKHDGTPAIANPYQSPIGVKGFNGISLEGHLLKAVFMDENAAYTYNLVTGTTENRANLAADNGSEHPAKEAFLNKNFYIIPIVSNGSISQIKLWNTNNIATYDSQWTECGGNITHISLQGQNIFVGTQAGTVLVFDLPTLSKNEQREFSPPQYLKKHKSPITAICADQEDPNFLASGDQAGNIALWHRQNAIHFINPREVAIAHLQIVKSTSKQETHLIAAYKDGLVEQWDIALADQAAQLAAPQEQNFLNKAKQTVGEVGQKAGHLVQATFRKFHRGAQSPGRR